MLDILNGFFKKIYTKPTLIPKLLHFIWLGDKEIPEYFNIYLSKWKQLYPEYKITIWDDSSIEDADIFPNNTIKNLYNSYSNNVFKADICRYCLLYKFGGIYFDVDFEPIKRIPDNFLNFDFLAAYQNEKEVNNAFIGSKPNTNILETTINDLPINVYKVINQVGEKNAFEHCIPDLAAPLYFTKKCNLYKNNDNYYFFTKEYFYPYWYTDKQDNINNDFKSSNPLSYAVHHWDMSWKELDHEEDEFLPVHMLGKSDELNIEMNQIQEVNFMHKIKE